MDHLNIRAMAEADDEAVSRIVSDGYHFIAASDGLGPAVLARMIAERCQPEHFAVIRGRSRCFVAEAGGAVLGFIAATGDHLEDLFVDPQHLRRGIASALFRRVEAGCTGPTLTVGTTGYGTPFYLAMGMRVTGKRRVAFGPLEGKELILLEKTLARREGSRRFP